ncbi:hypothetical protein HH310_21895 [Actinoplanes sp. TBRC 11911]|uniref:hypothetical protein n=1 Tax=Actinoplanes sp. TBRC 11911 TaxID=2729386 RepID=UPI00145E1C39|nr:hypothetical protein [Actinoplanes sp. TBRC 11911]NMO53823.1 hypothetical protein [Actinoplanes sp. TBRC 11911]
MRGGLDDALDKLARRDELRRRAAGEATGTPPAVTELVEAIAGVIAHNPQLGVTVGVEGAGDPLLLHFYFSDGQVQVNAENAVGTPTTDPAAAAGRHADFVVAVDATVEESYPPQRFYAESETEERRYGTFDAPAAPPPPAYEDPNGYPMPPQPRPSVPPQPGPAQHIQPEQYRAPAEPPAAERIPQQPQPNGMPAPLAHPVPLQVERPEETELAARRLAALLRDDPSLLNRPPD